MADGVPWINLGARFFIEFVLTPEGIVYEYGSGGSTIFYLKRTRRVYSVEHDPNWFERVRAVMTEKGLTNCDLRLIPPEPVFVQNGDPEDPAAYSSSDERYKGYSFRRYASSIDSFSDAFFDFVSVDGRARPSCIYHAHRKVKFGGYLMLDNSDISKYQKAKELLSGWNKHEFYGPVPYQNNFTEACIWIRPSSELLTQQ